LVASASELFFTGKRRKADTKTPVARKEMKQKEAKESAEEEETFKLQLISSCIIYYYR